MTYKLRKRSHVLSLLAGFDYDLSAFLPPSFLYCCFSSGDQHILFFSSPGLGGGGQSSF